MTTEERMLRTVADEDADQQEVVHNLTSHVFEDWPTEAGFDGLREERGPIEIPVTGTIPAWAAGNLYRTGPGQLKVEDTPNGTHYFNHWFDGLAHSHRFEIVAPEAAGGPVRVFYSSRRQSEELARLIQRQGAADLFSFGQRRDPCVSLLGKFMSTFKAAVFGKRKPSQVPDLDNVSVVVLADVPGLRRTASGPCPTQTSSGGHHNKLPANIWITTDAEIMRQIDPATLEPIGHAVQNVLHPDLKGPFSAAHAQRDPDTGDLYNFNLELGPSPTYRVFHVSVAIGQTEILATIPCATSARAGARPAYIHSFFMTEHYVVLCIPCTHVAYNGLKTLWERNIADGIEPFDPANKTRWLVVDRRPGSSRGVVAEFESDAGFFFHSVNAYEETVDVDGHVTTQLICDVVDYPSFDIVRTLYYDVLLNRNGAATDIYKDVSTVARVLPSLSRYCLTLPRIPKSHTASAERLWTMAAPHCGELPTIHPGYATRVHRYVYSLGNRGLSTLADGLVKVDTATRSALRWNAPETNVPGEPIFVPRPGSDRTEDDGVLLSVVLDGRAGTSYLLCLDAHTMVELGRAEVGFAVGIGFHGLHVGGGCVRE